MPKPQPHQVIQITDQTHPWFPALAIVREVKDWGVLAYVWIVNNTKEPNGRAYIRLKNEEFEVVGAAVIVPKSESEDE